jgi:hypothetical protein
MSTQGRLKSVNLCHGEDLAKVVIIPSSPPCSSVCQPLHTEGVQTLSPSFVPVPWSQSLSDKQKPLKVLLSGVFDD